MHQTDRGSYRTNESAFKSFRHSCLGKIVILLGILVILLVIALITKPSSEKMKREMDDNIKQSLWSRDSINADGMDIFVSNIGHTFSHFDPSIPVTAEMRYRLDSLFFKYNDTVFYDHTFFQTMYVNNHLGRTPERCGIGVFGLVIPTADFNKFIPRDGDRKEFNAPLIQQGEGEEYFGTTTVDVFHYEGGED
jgi:hypothetical protein